MKKIFTLIVAAFVATCVNAQVNVVDSEGKVCENGGVLEFFDELPEYPEIIEFGSPMLVNTSNSKVNVSLDVNIRQLPEGTSLSDCFSGLCTSYTATGSHKTSTKTIDPNSTLTTLIEWSCYNAAKDVNVEGVCIVDFTLYVNNQKSMTFTAKYINGEAASIKGVATAVEKMQGTYTMDGKRVLDNAKGLLIRNGKKVLKF